MNGFVVRASNRGLISDILGDCADFIRSNPVATANLLDDISASLSNNASYLENMAKSEDEDLP